MKVYYSDAHRLHDPLFEVMDGGERAPYLENPQRMARILSTFRKTDWAEIEEPADFGLAPILAVHDGGYLKFLASAWSEWMESNPSGDYSPVHSALLPATFALRSQSHIPKSLLGRAGYYIMDLSAVIVEGTYPAALASANCALSGAQAITQNEKAALALCRPPGHHAGRDFAAGYCFINNAAVAANWLTRLGTVAILDIDYHAGNGTQNIFYERSDVFSISIHADPAFEYPYYAGYADERGLGSGAGYHQNFPLPAGVGDAGYLTVLRSGLDLIRKYQPKFVVVSVGMDIYEGDPLGQFNVTRQGIAEIGRQIQMLNLPMLYVLEGGYNNFQLGENLEAFLNSPNAVKT